jgi:thymidylate synthase (FAD)
MRVVEPSYEIIYPTPEIAKLSLPLIERIARDCYQSADKIGPGTDKAMVEKLCGLHHTAMLEFGIDLVVRFVCERGVSHELVRHRLASYAQESTRYCKYKDGIVVVRPPMVSDHGRMAWEEGVRAAELAYTRMLDAGETPQIARSVLPTCVKTVINVKANLTEWRHIFKLRTPHTAHPQMRALMNLLLADVKKLVPVVFDDIESDWPIQQS